MIAEICKEIEQFQALRPVRNFVITRDYGDGTIEYKGKRVVNCCSFDYLGLRHNKQLVRSVQERLGAEGLSSCSPRLLSGTSVEVSCTENYLGKFLGQAGSLAFVSRNQAVFSLVSILVGEADVVLCSEGIQLPCADAAYLTNCAVAHFDHNDTSSLTAALERHRYARRRIVVLESVSPITGRVAPVAEIAAILRRSSAHLILDESLAVAALGSRGAGVAEGLLFGEELLAILLDSSFGLCASGCFVSGPAPILELLSTCSRTFACENAPSPHVMGLVADSMMTAEGMSIARRRLAAMAALLHQRLSALGVAVDGSGSPILSVRFDSSSLARTFADALLQRGFFVDTVVGGRSFSEDTWLRIILSVLHSEQQLDSLSQSIEDIYKRNK
jgi:7-keto-8-aminopelargonate synthetase-like enzyme